MHPYIRVVEEEIYKVMLRIAKILVRGGGGLVVLSIWRNLRVVVNSIHF
jgi:hypothetical protein